MVTLFSYSVTLFLRKETTWQWGHFHTTLQVKNRHISAIYVFKYFLHIDKNMQCCAGTSSCSSLSHSAAVASRRGRACCRFPSNYQSCCFKVFVLNSSTLRGASRKDLSVCRLLHHLICTFPSHRKQKFLTTADASLWLAFANQPIYFIFPAKRQTFHEFLLLTRPGFYWLGFRLWGRSTVSSVVPARCFTS